VPLAQGETTGRAGKTRRDGV